MRGRRCGLLLAEPGADARRGYTLAPWRKYEGRGAQCERVKLMRGALRSAQVGLLVCIVVVVSLCLAVHARRGYTVFAGEVM